MREDIVDKVLKRDIPALYKIRSIYDLERIFLYLCYHSSNIISLDTIAKELYGVTRPTVEKYIDFLEGANLISISRQLDVSGKKALKAQPKIYISDSGIRNSVIMNTDILTNPTEMGIVIETAVYNHVLNYYKNAQVGYMHDNKKEIDIVVVDDIAKKALIEVKYRDSYDRSKEIITKLATPDILSLLITKKNNDYGTLPDNENVFRIPSFAYMYLIG
jgi:predicted AAA+ superfamily ATPase